MSSHPDYYLILGVSNSANASEIKSAYRQLVKKWHPDVNDSKEAITKSQEINDAYSILGSPERRALYDAGNHAAAVDPATRATEVDFDPVTCNGCGAISAQPRYVQFVRIISVGIASYRSHPGGVFCVSCACKRLFINTLLTGAVGWLGIWGFFWSLGALLTNLRGGIKPPDLNAFVLGKQSVYFLKNGNAKLACTLAKESLLYFKKSSAADLNYGLGVNGAELANYVLQQPNLQPVKIKCKWKGWSSPARAALFGLSIPAIFWAAILGANYKKTDYLDNNSSNSSEKYTSPTRYTAENSSLSNSLSVELKPNGSTFSSSSTVNPEPTFSFQNTNGTTYNISRADSIRLRPIYNALQTRDRAIKEQEAGLSLKKTILELESSTIMTELKTELFNQKVEKWNSDKNAYNLEVESYNQAVDSYNSELERVGHRIN